MSFCRVHFGTINCKSQPLWLGVVSASRFDVDVKQQILEFLVVGALLPIRDGVRGSFFLNQAPKFLLARQKSEWLIGEVCELREM